jgi:uncharacterized FAD-dependent dehydrogenase
MTNFEYVFIGAGFANLAAANILLRHGIERILVLEQGTAIQNRSCPGVETQKCYFCGKGCSIITGLGGTNALFGNKLCYFPASRAILNYFDDETIVEAFASLDTELSGVFDSANNRTENGDVADTIKQYNSIVLSPTQFQAMVDRLLQPLSIAGAVRISSKVERVDRVGRRSFQVLMASGERISASNIVLGTGRGSESFLRSVCSSLGIPVRDNNADIGIRIEAPVECFSDCYNYQEDPKLKFTFGSDGTARTFCAENRGIVVPVPFRSSFFAEGAYPSEVSSRNNVALMVRSFDPLSSEEIERWCRAINRKCNDQLVLGRIPLQGLTNVEVLSALVRVLPTFPTPVHDRLMRLLIQRLFSGPTNLLKSRIQNEAEMCIYAPAIDNFWPRPEVRHNLFTRVPGIFILGDAIGVSRGYVQALTSGAAWALTRVRESLNPTINNFSTCLDLV